jgi:anti-sigma regulatory factor (Ser/Thr protein kinase)
VNGRLDHPALFYRGWADYLAGTVPFIRDGLAADQPVAVAVPPPNLEVLRSALGGDAGRVRMLDMTSVGRNPGAIIPGVLRAFVDEHDDGGRVRIVGQPIWPGRTDVEYPACVQHEALINRAFEGRDVTILCPYHTEGLAPEVLADAEATHPVVIDRTGERVSAAYAPDEVVGRWNLPLPTPPADFAALRFDLDGLAAVRRFVTGHAVAAGLPDERVTAVVMTVNELSTNSVVHGGGAGTVRIWVEPGHLGCETSDAGWLTDPLAGRRPVALDGECGRGLLLVNRLADLVRVHSTAASGTTVRVYFRR